LSYLLFTVAAEIVAPARGWSLPAGRQEPLAEILPEKP